MASASLGPPALTVAATASGDDAQSALRAVGRPGPTAPPEASPGPKLPVVPAWEALLGRTERDPTRRARAVRILPRSPDYYAAERRLVADQAGAEALLDFARQRPIAFIGIDCEYRYSRPGVFVRRSRGEDRFWYDPHSLIPLLLAVVLVELSPDGQAVLYRFVVDLRRPGVLGPLGTFFRLPVPFVAHFARAELF